MSDKNQLVERRRRRMLRELQANTSAFIKKSKKIRENKDIRSRPDRMRP